ncbi:MAG TPA: DUF368 domain-containing protein [Thermoanaerobaculia bacterium]|nr:DUF368 domain-containing protein [Thermoanaerobaculia bacterium]
MKPSSPKDTVGWVALARSRRKLRDYLGLFARGFCMGSADVVPGVSGGTMAFILGIYEELIDSIRVVGRPEFLRPLVRLRLGEALRVLNWEFLTAILTGIGLAIITMAKGLEWLLHNQPVVVWSFFFGLVLASVFLVGARIARWTPSLLAALAAGTVGAYLLVGLVPVQTPDQWWFLFLSGAVAICAMILPGISGAFVLVLLGKYQQVLGAVNQHDLVTLGWVALGALIGIVTFAQVLGWLFHRYHDPTVALLTGLMLGSLRKVWPWKEDLAFIIDRHGERLPTVQRNVLPESFSGEVIVAISMAVAGLILVIALERWAHRLGRRSEEELA